MLGAENKTIQEKNYVEDIHNQEAIQSNQLVNISFYFSFLIILEVKY